MSPQDSGDPVPVPTRVRAQWCGHDAVNNVSVACTEVYVQTGSESNEDFVDRIIEDLHEKLGRLEPTNDCNPPFPS